MSDKNIANFKLHSVAEDEIIIVLANPRKSYVNQVQIRTRSFLSWYA